MNALALVQGTEEIHLHGAGISAPLRGARRVKCTPTEDGWVEEVEVYFEGPPEAVRDRQSQIERLLARGGVRLRLEAYPGAEAVEARLSKSTRETLAWNQGDGVGALRLELTRAEAWQGPARELALSNPGGAGVTGGLAIYGHVDSGHWNYADIQAAELEGDQPGSICLEVENASPGASTGDMVICIDAGDAPDRAGRFLEGEAAAGGSLVTQSDCSGGAARQVEANSTGGTLLTWALQTELLEWQAGRPARPTARLCAPPAAGKAWVWWQLRSGATLLWSSERELLSDETLPELPVLWLPPLGLDNPAGLALELAGKTGSGTASFSLDFVQLSPLDGWRRYRAAGTLPPGGVLVDDGFERRVYARTAAGATGSYAGEGGPLRLWPGRDQRLYVLHDGGVDVPLRVRVWYRPAWKNF